MSGELADEGKREKEKEERKREKEGKREDGGETGGRGDVAEVSRDDAVVRLQGRRKEEPRAEGTGPGHWATSRPSNPPHCPLPPPPLSFSSFTPLRPSFPPSNVLPPCEPHVVPCNRRVESRCLQVLQTMSTLASLIMLSPPATTYVYCL